MSNLAALSFLRPKGSAMTFKYKLSVRLALLKDALALVLAGALCACEKPASIAGPGPAPVVTRVAISPNRITLSPGQTSRFMAVGLTATGDTADVDVTWSATGGTIVDTSSSGSYHYATYQPSAVPGTYLVIATDPPATALADTSTVVVVPVPVSSVAVSPAVASLLVGATVQLTATPHDASGAALSGRAVTWTSSAPAVATVSTSGVVTGQVAGSATITATSEGKSGTATITVQTPPPPPPPPPPGSHAGYYVAPTGSASGSGSASQPWDLATALNQPAAVQPGDTIWLRGGTYSGNFQSYLTGIAAAPIVLRQYPGEHATIAGTLAVGAAGTTRGSYSWYWGFEIYNPNLLGAYQNGVSQLAPGSKLINLVVHDHSGAGIYSGNQASGGGVPTEVYGCIAYNNGTTDNRDHGLYIMNQGSVPRLVTDNIVFNNWSIGIQAYASAPTQFLDNLRLVGNMAFNNNTIGTSGGMEILVGGSGVRATGAIVDHNYTYRNNSMKTVDLGWYFNDVGNQDLTLTNNYFVGLLEVDDWVTATVTGNTVYSTSSAVTYAAGLVANRGNLSGHTWSGNTFYGLIGATQWSYVPSGAFNPMAYPAWLAATGALNPGALIGTPPTAVLAVVRPNQYEAGRANIAVYNWTGQSTVAVDVSNVLSVGQTYAVMSVFDMYGTPVLRGTYAGGSLQLPMTAIPAPAPLARGHAGPATGGTFNAFVLMTTP